MSSLQFQIANKKGREGQDFVCEMINSWKGFRAYSIPSGFFPDYDLEVITPLGKRSTLEVKTDLMANKTGNICLELDALEHSKADILAIVVKPPITVYMKELSEVRELARKWHRKVRVGEFGLEAALVPRSIFLDRLKPQILTTRPN